MCRKMLKNVTLASSADEDDEATAFSLQCVFDDTFSPKTLFVNTTVSPSTLKHSKTPICYGKMLQLSFAHAHVMLAFPSSNVSTLESVFKCRRFGGKR